MAGKRRSTNMVSRERRRIASKFPFFLVLLVGFTAWGAGSPIIYSTSVNTTTNRITIIGAAFSPTGLAPDVVFAATTLVLISFTNQSALAKLPTGFKPGSYS